MTIPQTTNPHLTLIGQTLGRSMQRHLVENTEVRSAFAELVFELELARHGGAPSDAAPLLAPSA